MPDGLTGTANAKPFAITPRRGISSAAALVANTPFVIPRFDEFARLNPFVGSKVGAPQVLSTGNWVQEFQHATAYAPPGALASEIHEVQGAIRERYRSFGGPDGFLGLPLTNEMTLSDGQGKFNHFQRGSIFWHPSTGAREIHGQIRDHWEALGWERGWLGYPISDEESLQDQDAGRVSSFQHGAIYWWPELGARAVNNVVVEYTGIHCFGETDKDGFFGTSDDDEPFATLGVVGPDNIKGMAQTRTYDDVDAGEGIFDVIELYRGQPRGLTISALLQEHTGSADQAALSRTATQSAVDSAGPLIQRAASAVPYIGSVLGPLSGAAWDFFKKDIAEALTDLVGLVDRPLGSDLITLTPQQLVLLATRPEGHAQFNAIPWRFETQLLARQGASYKLYFNVYPA